MQVQEAEIKQWGNSYGFIIPKSYFNIVDFPKDNKIRFTLDPNKFKIVVEESKPKYKYTLAELLKGYSPERRHKETYWGPDVGKEIVEYE